jgi:PAS domain S-box-containing protein
MANNLKLDLQMADELNKLRQRVAELEAKETELERAEKELRESQRSLSTLISNLPGIAYRCRNDQQWTMEFISLGCLDLTGYSVDELTGNHKTSFNEIIIPEDREAVRETVTQAITVRQPFKMNYRITTKDGGNKWVWEQGRGVFLEDGTLAALEGFITDITERKKVEEALAFEQTLMLALMDNIPDAFYFKDLQSRFIRVSKATAVKHGLESPQQMIGKTDFDFFVKESAQLKYDEEQEIVRTV